MKKIITFIALVTSTVAYSQSIGVGTTTPSTSAILDVTSSNKGMLVPRMNSVTRNGILSPAVGLLVYDTDTNTFWYFNGLVWTNLASAVLGGWSLTGNGGTLPATHFLGTTDNLPLRWRVNNIFAGELNPVTGNSFYGQKAGLANTLGVENVAVGQNALSFNTAAGRNVAIGNNALQTQSFANGGVAWNSDNVALGYAALFSNQPNSIDSGYGNTAMGNYALNLNTRGSVNTAQGLNALFLNTNGTGNTATGYSALQSNTSGTFNTAVGFLSDANGNNYTNASAFGNLALVTASDQVRIGNANVTSIGGYAGWTTLPSDSRFKKNVQPNVPGLAFISKLRPVTYTLDIEGIDRYLGRDKQSSFLGKNNSSSIAYRKGMASKEQIVYSGFIAQEVERAAKETGYDFSGVDVPKNDKDVYGLRYAEFVVPLVKAVQEQQGIITDQKKEIADLKERLEKIEKKLK
jgi:hypothetical protein